MIAAATSGLRKPSARCQSHHSSPYENAWMIFRPIVSHTPRPELRSGWADRKKITAITRIGGPKREIARIGR